LMVVSLEQAHSKLTKSNAFKCVWEKLYKDGIEEIFWLYLPPVKAKNRCAVRWARACAVKDKVRPENTSSPGREAISSHLNKIRTGLLSFCSKNSLLPYSPFSRATRHSCR